MAPSRPLLYPEQLGLILITLGLIGIGAYLFVRALS
jgi:hypothetical protein